MPYEDSGKSPASNSEDQSISKPPISPHAPQENEGGEKPTSGTGGKEVRTAKRERDIKTICSIVINGLLLIVTVIIAVIYNGQLKQMRNATKATQIAAEAAKNSADLQRTIVEGTQAAVVMLNELDLNDRNFLRVSVMNVGGVISAKSTVDIEVSRQHLPDKRLLGATQVFHFAADNLHMRQPSDTHVFEIVGYTQKDKWNIYHKRQAIILNITVEFENGFGKWVQRKSCSEYLSIYGPKDHPQNPEMTPCESVAMRFEQVLPPEQRAWKWQQ